MNDTKPSKMLIIGYCFSLSLSVSVSVSVSLSLVDLPPGRENERQYLMYLDISGNLYATFSGDGGVMEKG